MVLAMLNLNSIIDFLAAAVDRWTLVVKCHMFVSNLIRSLQLYIFSWCSSQSPMLSFAVDKDMCIEF